MTYTDEDFAAEYKRLVSDDFDDMDEYEYVYKKEGRYKEHSISKKKTRSLMEHTREKKKKNFTRESLRNFDYD